MTNLIEKIKSIGVKFPNGSPTKWHHFAGYCHTVFAVHEIQALGKVKLTPYTDWQYQGEKGIMVEACAPVTELRKNNIKLKINHDGIKILEVWLNE